MNGSRPDGSQRDDSPADRRLGKALAHAPDRDLVPPPHLSAQILAAAHREAAEPAVPPPRVPLPWWRRPWGASGALATVALAGFLGLLWRGDPPGPAVDGPAPVPVQTAQAPAPAAVPVTAPAAVEPKPEPSRPVEAPVLAQAARQRAAAPAKATQANEAQATAAQATEGARAADMQVARATPATPSTQATAGAGKMTADQAAATVAPAAAAPPTLPAPAPAMAPPRAAVAAAATPQRAQMAETMVSRPASVGLPPLLPGDQLAWQPASGAAVPGAAWLQQLAALTRGRWLPAAEEVLSAGAAPASALLVWQRSGAPLGVLRWESTAVIWCAAGQTCLRALVPPDALRDLVGKLPGER